METISTPDVAPRLAELLDRAAHGETFEIIQDGRMVARLLPPVGNGSEAPTLKDLILNGPSLEGVLQPRDRSPMREIEL